MNAIEKMLQNERITIRKAGAPVSDGKYVAFWMQRAQRAMDNPALNGAVTIANELKKPVVVFFAAVPFYPRANSRHYRFLAEVHPGPCPRPRGAEYRTCSARLS